MSALASEIFVKELIHMMKAKNKRKGDCSELARLSRNIETIDRAIEAKKAEIAKIKLALTRARCGVDTISRSAENERSRRDCSRAAQIQAPARKAFYEELQEKALFAEQFYNAAKNRVGGTDLTEKTYAARAHHAHEKAVNAAAEASRYSHVGYHSFDPTVLRGFSAQKDALNIQHREFKRASRELDQLLRTKKRLTAQLCR